MIQTAWILCDDKGNRIEYEDYIIKPGNFEIPRDSYKVHGILTEKAINEGADLESVLNKFNRLIQKLILLLLTISVLIKRFWMHNF